MNTRKSFNSTAFLRQTYLNLLLFPGCKSLDVLSATIFFYHFINGSVYLEALLDKAVELQAIWPADQYNNGIRQHISASHSPLADPSLPSRANFGLARAQMWVPKLCSSAQCALPSADCKLCPFLTRVSEIVQLLTLSDVCSCRRPFYQKRSYLWDKPVIVLLGSFIQLLDCVESRKQMIIIQL